MRIAIFDSGVGGLTVLKEALKILPNENYIYFADTDHIPYGTKPKDEVKTYIFDSVEFLVKQNIKALVVACNTATSIAINDLRAKYSFPIIGMEPAVKPAVVNNKNKRVLVVATPLTLKEDKYQNLVTQLDSQNVVDEIPLPELVKYAENFCSNENEVEGYLRQSFDQLDIKNYSAVVLGCTHFPFYSHLFKKIFGTDTSIIDGNLGTVNHLKNILTEKGLLSSEGMGEVTFITSGRIEAAENVYVDYLKKLGHTFNKN